VSKNRVLRRIFGPKEKVIGGDRKLYNDMRKSFIIFTLKGNIIKEIKSGRMKCLCPDSLLGPPNLLSIGYRGLFP
jgi:hypothetical protein